MPALHTGPLDYLIPHNCDPCPSSSAPHSATPLPWHSPFHSCLYGSSLLLAAAYTREVSGRNAVPPLLATLPCFCSVGQAPHILWPLSSAGPCGPPKKISAPLPVSCFRHWSQHTVQPHVSFCLSCWSLSIEGKDRDSLGSPVSVSGTQSVLHASLWSWIKTNGILVTLQPQRYRPRFITRN